MTLKTAKEVSGTFYLNRIATDIKVNNCSIVTLNYVSELLETTACEVVLTEVDLSKFFVIFENLCYY